MAIIPSLSVIIGVIEFIMFMMFAITSVGLPFGHIESVIWTEPLYWGIILPLFFFTLANVVYVFFVYAINRNPAKKHIFLAITSCFFWVFAWLSSVYSLIIFIIVRVACEGNAQCDKNMICDESGYIPGRTYAGARPRFTLLIIENSINFILSIVLIVISCIGMRSVDIERKKKSDHLLE